ncbi:MAG TPA: PEP-CTERM sorting domain-containing protein [Tepidisphaeraceae bacterium]|jgi:probable HAF family extracellular repeat protein
MRFLNKTTVLMYGLTAASVARAATYSITDIGTLGGASSFGLDVNTNRQVSGNSNITAAAATAEGATGTTLRAYSYTGGTLTNPGALPGSTTNRFARGYAINDGGVVVGEFNNDSSRAFVYNPATGSMAGLIRLAGGSDSGTAVDINNGGGIVGVSSNGTTSRATKWTLTAGTYAPADLGSIDGLTTTPARANAVNSNGSAAGLSRNAAGTSQATLWSGGGVINLGSLGDGTRFSSANGINDANSVVGYSYTGQTVGQLIGTTSTTVIQRAFLAQGGTNAELPPVNLYSPTNTGTTTNYHSVANDINSAGLVVGNSQRISGSPAVATLWMDGVPIDLNTLIPAGSGWFLTSAEGINSAGDITGYGTIGGATHAFLLTVPEPGSLAIIGLSGITILGRKRR